MRRSTAFVSSIIFLFLFASSVFADPSIRALTPQSVQSVQEQAKHDDVEIRLAHEHFDPLVKVPAIHGKGSANIQTYGAGGVGYYIVQFDAPIEASWKKALEDVGVKIFDYIPDFAFIVKMDTSKEGTVRGLAHVRWLGIFQPSYKVSQHALDKTYTERTILPVASPPVRLHISVFPGEDLNSIKTMINGTGATILDTVTTEWGTTMKIEIPAEKIPDLSYITGIKWIEPEPKWQLFNNVSTDVMNVRTPRDSHGLYGAGQTVGIADTGLDTGNIATLHLDFSDGAGFSRVISLIDLVGDGTSDVNSGHGTHVAGSVLGNGMTSGCNSTTNYFPSNCFAGIAPKANLVFQALENNATGQLTGIPPDLNTLFSQSQTAGANLHTNSWGSNVQGTYTGQSTAVDQYMWSHKDFLILFAAGNNGADLNGDGVVDLYNIGAPGTAKNCLTVGASEGYRPSGAGIDAAYGAVSWVTGPGAYLFSTNPIYSDHVSNNAGGMAAFSSQEGRRSMEGTSLISLRLEQIYSRQDHPS